MQDPVLNSCKILTTHETPSKTAAPCADPHRKLHHLTSLAVQNLIIANIRPTFPRPQNLKKQMFSKPSTNLTNRARGCPRPHLGSFWMSFGTPFSINFLDRPNLLICNPYNAKTSFLHLQASLFGIKNQTTNHILFKPVSWTSMFCLEKWSMLGPLQNPVGAQFRPPVKD